MKLQFSGDRNSRTIAIGKFFKRLIGRRFISVMLWDGYGSWIRIVK